MSKSIDSVSDRTIVWMGVIFMIFSIAFQSLAPIILFAVFVYVDVNRNEPVSIFANSPDVPNEQLNEGSDE